MQTDSNGTQSLPDRGTIHARITFAQTRIWRAHALAQALVRGLDAAEDPEAAGDALVEYLDRIHRELEPDAVLMVNTPEQHRENRSFTKEEGRY